MAKKKYLVQINYTQIVEADTKEEVRHLANNAIKDNGGAALLVIVPIDEIPTLDA
jgi:hypothetical protein